MTKSIFVTQKRDNGTFDIPFGKVPPAHFWSDAPSKDGKRKGPWTQLRLVSEYVQLNWMTLFPQDVEEWKQFIVTRFPEEHDSEEFIHRYPDRYHVPFCKLFSSGRIHIRAASEDAEPAISDRVNIIQARWNPSIRTARTDIQPRSIINTKRYGFASDLPAK